MATIADPASPPAPAAPPRVDTHNNFDLLRLLAALQVAYFHITYHLKIELGDAGRSVNKVLDLFSGVPIFFVISGFLISKSYERSRGIRSYAWNRFLRIYPALWVAFAASLIALGWHGFLGWSAVTDRHFAAWIAAQLTIGQFYSPDMVRGYGVGTPNGSLWTIPVELGFYVALPVLYVAVRRLRARTADLLLAAIALASYTTWYAIVRRPDHDQALALKLALVTSVPYLHMFLMGVLAHRSFDRLRRLFEGKALAWTAGYIASMLILDRLFGPERKTSYLLALLSNVGLAGWTLSVAFTGRSLSERVLRGNDLSYGLYIYHMIVVNVLVHRRALGDVRHALLAGVISFALAACSWRLVESPALKLKSSARARAGRAPGERAGAVPTGAPP